MIDKKWPTTKKAFDDFLIEKVSCFTESDINGLIKDEGIVRNRGKILAIIENAKKFQRIKKECGSFQKYLDNVDKSNNYAKVIDNLSSKFKWLGPSSARMYLHSVGEKIKHT